MRRRSFLVTGGSGFLGSALVRRLVVAGHQVRVLDNNSRGRRERLADLGDSYEFLEGDIRDSTAVDRAIRGVDCVCHLAFVNGTEFFYSRPALVLDVGVKGIVNIIDACRRNNVRELLLVSSSEVYQHPPRIPTDESVPLSIPDPLNPRYSYAAGKIVSEIMAINYGRTDLERVVIVRPHNVYGPDMGWEHVIPQFATRMARLCERFSGTVPFPIQGTGEEMRAFVHVDDFTNGLIIALEYGAHLGIYHIGTTEEVSIATLAHEVARCLGSLIRILPGEAAVGATPRRCPDISKISALGYRPTISLCDGLKPVVTWYAEQVDRQPATQ